MRDKKVKHCMGVVCKFLHTYYIVCYALSIVLLVCMCSGV